MTLSPRQHGREFACSAAVTLLFALVVVLQRALVVCEGPHCGSRIEFAHRGDECCAHDCAGAEGDDAPIGTSAGARPHGCSDSVVHLPDSTPPMRAATATADLEPEFAPAACASTGVAATTPADPRPPTRGPPRQCSRAQLRRTIVLLV